MPDILKTDQIDALLHQQYIGRLGCYADNDIYVVPITYAYDGSNIYGHCYAGTKLDMMRSNPNVCLQTDNVDSLFNWQSVIAWGTFEEVNSPEEKASVEKLLHSRSMPFQAPDLNAGDIILFKIVVTKKTGRCNNTAPHDTSSVK